MQVLKEGELMEKFIEHPEALFGAWIGLGIGIVLVSAVIIWLFNIACMMIGAKVANIENRSFGKAFLATLLIAILGGGCVSLLTLLHPLIGLVGLVLVPAIFIHWVYSCGLGKAIIAYIINLVATGVLIAGMVVSLLLVTNVTAKTANAHTDASSTSTGQTASADQGQASEKK